MAMTDLDLNCLLALLADPARLSALALLADGDELCVCELMASLGVTQSRLSRHMSALKVAGLVTDRRDAQWVRYRLAWDLDPRVRRILDAALAASDRPRLRRPGGKSSDERRIMATRERLSQ